MLNSDLPLDWRLRLSSKAINTKTTDLSDVESNNIDRNWKVAFVNGRISHVHLQHSTASIITMYTVHCWLRPVCTSTWKY